MDNKLAENMLRFGVKNLSEASKIKLSEQTNPVAPATLSPGLEADRKLIAAMTKGLQSFVSPTTGILYIPTTKNPIGVETQNIAGYGIMLGVHKSKSTDDYTFPNLVVIGNIDVSTKNVGGRNIPTIMGLDKMTQVVSRMQYRPDFDVNIIQTVRNNDAGTWDLVKGEGTNVADFINRNKSKLTDLDLNDLNIKTNEISKGVFSNPAEFVAARNAIKLMGGNV